MFFLYTLICHETVHMTDHPLSVCNLLTEMRNYPRSMSFVVKEIFLQFLNARSVSVPILKV